MNSTDPNRLPVVSCEGCGVCCLHMGYPAFILPRSPMSDREIDAQPELLDRIRNDWRLRDDLKSGHPGEPAWHALPEPLRQQWQLFVANYQPPDYTGEVASFDGPCCWFDTTTRQCQNHTYRPQICRDFETGSRGCLDWRKFYRDRIESSTSTETTDGKTDVS